MEINPPRNSQLELIDADECRECAGHAAPGFTVPHRTDRFPMPEKLIYQVAAQRPPFSASPLETRTRARS